MLLTESETARVLRQTILDIVIDTINKRTGGGTKYINQRDEEFLQASFAEENYRKDSSPKGTSSLRSPRTPASTSRAFMQYKGEAKATHPKSGKDFTSNFEFLQQIVRFTFIFYIL